VARFTAGLCSVSGTLVAPRARGLNGVTIALYTACYVGERALAAGVSTSAPQTGAEGFRIRPNAAAHQAADGRRQLSPARPQRSYRHWHCTIGDPQTRKATGNISPPNRGSIAPPAQAGSGPNESSTSHAPRLSVLRPARTIAMIGRVVSSG
jgi:hypothetical protein